MVTLLAGDVHSEWQANRAVLVSEVETFINACLDRPQTMPDSIA